VVEERPRADRCRVVDTAHAGASGVDRLALHGGDLQPWHLPAIELVRGCLHAGQVVADHAASPR